MVNIVSTIVRSSRPEVFCKNGVLRNFSKFTGEHLRQSPFFDKVVGLRQLLAYCKFIIFFQTK